MVDAQALSGVIYPKNGLTGRPFIITAPVAQFERWKQDGTFERINSTLNQLDREGGGKEAHPSVLSIDKQSVKLNPMICEYRGIDANKRVNGRKRQFVVDTQGRLWIAAVHAANQGDGPAAVSLVGDILWRVGERLEKVYGDQPDNGVFAKALVDWGIYRTSDPVRESFSAGIDSGFRTYRQAMGCGTEYCLDESHGRPRSSAESSKITSIRYYLR
ncbi:transposase [Spirosoma agri]|uniref:transposase n=1 Tax=Spirosoma agri TaxID=1987381 RepID=UPI001FE730BF|nr:transposase [Spirosoma agri]